MRIGLTFDEYADLRLRPPADANPAFKAAAELEREQLFPMSRASASSHLRTRGYDCRPPTLDVLVRNDVVSPAAPRFEPCRAGRHRLLA